MIADMTILRHPSEKRGFANPEPMILIAIIGIVLAVAIPQFARARLRAKELDTRKALTALRSALAAYHKDMGGRYPAHVSELLLGDKYLRSVPKAKVPPHHMDSDSVRLALHSSDSDDSGGWAYVAEPSSKDWGTVFVNCTHTDIKGASWSDY